MASLDLWIDGDWGKAVINWHESEVAFDLERFHYDQYYADLVNQHVKHALEYLGKELAEISRMTPPEETDYDWTHCE